MWHQFDLRTFLDPSVSGKFGHLEIFIPTCTQFLNVFNNCAAAYKLIQCFEIQTKYILVRFRLYFSDIFSV